MNQLTKILKPVWQQHLQNPVWYITVVAGMVVLTSYFSDLWWFAGLVALSWGAYLVQQYFGSRPDTDSLREDAVRPESYLAQTLAYKSEIERTIKAITNSHNRLHLAQLTTQLETCAQAIEVMVQRLETFQQDALVHLDLIRVPQAIADLEERLVHESNAATAAGLNQLLTARKNQWAWLERLQNTIQQTEIQLEHTVSILGSIYSQLLIGQSTNEMADYGRLTTAVDEEMRRLADHLEALDEVKGRYGVMATQSVAAIR